jgi:hypothetical protein
MARLLHQWEQTPSRPACMRTRVFANAGAATLKAHKPFFCAARRYDPLTAASTNQTPARYNCLFPSGCANRDAEKECTFMHYTLLARALSPQQHLARDLLLLLSSAHLFMYTRRQRCSMHKSNGTCSRGTRLYIPRANWSRRRRSIWPLRCLDCFGTSYKC